MTQFRNKAIAWIAVVMAAAVLLGLAGLYGLTGARQAFAATTADDAVIFEDFEDAMITNANDRKTVSSNIYAPSTVDISIVEEATGNKALKFMFAPAAATDDLAISDTRALIIEKTDAVPWASYVVSFYVKKASSLDSTFRVRSGLPSNNYGEHRAISTAGTDENGRPPMAADSADQGMLVTQVIPCDPWGTLRISIYPTVASAGAGIVIDDILVEPYSVAPEGVENELLNPGFYGEWRDVGGTWQWVFDNWMQPTAGAAFNGNWDPWCLSDGFSGYLGTADGAPVQLTQNVTLEPDTEYNFSIWVKKAYTALSQVPHAQDVFSVKLVSGDNVVSKVDFQADMIGQDAFEQYVKLGGVLKTGEATDYTFVLEYDVPDPATGVPMSWRVMQLDDVALYKADTRTELDYDSATKTDNVTVADDAFSEIEGDQILQADISQGDAKIVFPITVEANKLYSACVDAQKLPGASAVLNMVKPMNVRFSVETAADGSGTTLAELTDTRKISKAIQTLELVFNSGDNTQLYLVVTVDGLPETEDQYILNNCLIGFKNFAFALHDLETVSAGENRNIRLHGTTAVQAMANYTGGISLDVTGEAQIVSEQTDIVTVEGAVLTGVGVGTSTINVSYEGKTTSFTVTVLDNVLSVEAGEDRSIPLNQTGALTVTADYEVGENADVTAQAEVVIADPAIVSYESGTFTALKVGSTQVTVNFGGQSDTFTITVPKELSSVSAPAELTVPIGSEVSVTVTGHYNDGTSADVSAEAALSTESDKLTIGGNKLTGVAAGDAEVTVSYGGKQTTIAVSVTNELKSISAGEDRTVAMGSTCELVVTATYADDSTATIPTASVVVDIEDDAIVSYADGVFTPLQAGDTNVTVTYGGKTDTFKITVYVKTLTSIEITNGDLTLEFGKTAELEVIGRYNDGDSAPVNALFGIRSGSAVIVENGVVTAVRGGTAVIEASFGGQSDTIMVTVPKTVTGVSLGNAFELAVGENRTLSLTVTYNDGTSETVTEGITLSSKDDKLTVSGLTVTAAKSGEGQISVTYEGLTATVTVTVTNPVRSITVEAGAAKAGDPVTLTVKVKYADGSEQTITEGYTVTSSDAAVVSADGTSVRAEAAGTATLTVSYGGQSATVSVTVEEGGCGSALDAAWPALCIVLIVAAAACIIIQRKKA